MLTNNKDYIAVWEEYKLSPFEQMKLYVKNEIERNGINHEVFTHEITAALPLRFGHDNKNNQPSDYCYNLWNESFIGFDWPVFFERMEKGKFRILGDNYPYTGEIIDAKTQGRKEVVKGYWVESKRYKGKHPTYPDDLPDNSTDYVEGKKRMTAVNIYERNPEARAKCINAYGAVCVMIYDLYVLTVI